MAEPITRSQVTTFVLLGLAVIVWVIATPAIGLWPFAVWVAVWPLFDTRPMTLTDHDLDQLLGR